MSKRPSPSTPDPYDQPAVSWQSALLFLLAAVIGADLALWILPNWLPALLTDIAVQKAPWHLARVSGVVAYILLWLSTALGLSITNRLARAWPGGPTAFDLHQFTSLLALAFAGFHAVILLGDEYIGYTWAQILIPFAATGYKPVATAWGQIGLYLALIVTFSFYIRSRLGRRAWRFIHFSSFLLYGLITLHAILAGTDASALALLYIISIASILFLTIYRVLITRFSRS
ncbi:MAG: hypothetical protein GXP42_07665 [Chloroflexi bacterium]|nr:hypothetical protein [Chloroflexota bacterium]